MPIRFYKPTTPGQRGMSTQDFDGITAKKPVRSLLVAKLSRGGRNNQGRITTRHKGGGVDRFYRIISFSLPEDFSGKIEQIEYDPNRSARIARVKSDAGQYHYILA